MRDDMDELCANCGLTFGSHKASSPNLDQCPGHEGRMDWDAGPGTSFRASGQYFGDEADPNALMDWSQGRRP